MNQPAQKPDIQPKAEPKPRPKNIHESIEAMTALLAKEGIAKDKGGTQEIKYNFRGIDDIRNVIAPLQKECALNIIPKVLKRDEKERPTKNGGFSLWVTLDMEFDLTNTIDGSKVTAPIIAEAVDYSDKATQKAMSQAYKMMAINVFNIPTEGEQDTDAEKKEFAGKRVGVFETDELRRMWVSNCKGAFEQAESLVALKDVETFYHEKLILMGASQDVADKAEASEIRAIYTAMTNKFKSEAPKGKL